MTSSQDPASSTIPRAAADQPITRCADDRLGRETFASAIARALGAWAEPESLVVALTGAWGSGKTSVKNCVKEILGNMREPRPDVLEFAPWLITNREELAKIFFRDVAIKFGRPDDRVNRQIARGWRRLAVHLTLAADLVSLLPKRVATSAFWIALVSVLVASYRGAARYHPTAYWIAVAVVIASAVLATSATAAKKVAAYFGALAFDDRTIEEVRNELRPLLADRERSLIVIVDDIDRLPADEIQVVLQLVKAVADLPRLVFFLLFERDVVTKALEDKSHVNGDEYLQKIIQIPFMLPSIDPAAVQAILVEDMNTIIRELPASPKTDEKRWWNLYFAGVAEYIRDLRDVNQYITGIRFHVQLFMASPAVLEVNPVDLFGIEALRVFEPALYAVLYQHKALLLSGPGQSYSGSNRASEAKVELDHLLQVAKNSTAAKKIIATIFDPIQWLVTGYGYGSGFESNWQRDMRVCSDEYFDRYLQLAISKDDIPAAEIEELIAQLTNPGEVEQRICDIARRGQLIRLVAKLQPLIDRISTSASAVQNVVTSIFNSGDDLPQRAPRSGLPAVWFVSAFLQRILLSIQDGADRARVLREAATSSTGVYLPAWTIARMIEDPKSAGDAPGVPIDFRSGLKSLMVEKMTRVAASGALMSQAHLRELLSAWLEFGVEVDEIKRWTAEAIANEPLRMLEVFVTPVELHGMSDATSRTTYRFDADEVAKFADVDQLDTELERVDAMKSTSHAEMLKAFRRAMKARRDGKPTSGVSWMATDDDDD